MPQQTLTIDRRTYSLTETSTSLNLKIPSLMKQPNFEKSLDS